MNEEAEPGSNLKSFSSGSLNFITKSTISLFILCGKSS